MFTGLLLQEKADAKESSLRRQQPGSRAEFRSWLQCSLHSAEASTLYPSGERIPHLGWLLGLLDTISMKVYENNKGTEKQHPCPSPGRLTAAPGRQHTMAASKAPSREGGGRKNDGHQTLLGPHSNQLCVLSICQPAFLFHTFHSSNRQPQLKNDPLSKATMEGGGSKQRQQSILMLPEVGCMQCNWQCGKNH